MHFGNNYFRKRKYRKTEFNCNIFCNFRVFVFLVIQDYPQRVIKYK